MDPIIRLVRPEDVTGILEIYAPYVEGSPVTFEEIVPSGEEMVARIERISRQFPYLVCEIDGKIAGYAYASDYRTRSAYRWIKELSVYIHPGFRRRKIAHALYSCLLKILKIQGVTSVLAGITVPNPESVGFHEHFGFRKAGEFHANGFKSGQWHNVGWWEMNLNPTGETPCRQVTPISEIPEKILSGIFADAIKTVSL
jgi:L-amino acid N-acyltransferase YncA